MTKRRIFVLATLFAVGCSSPSEPKKDDNNVNVDEDMGSSNVSANMQTVDMNNGLTPDMNTGTGCQATGCPDTQVCNMQTGVCVDCLTDAECGDNGSCDPTSNKCRCDEGFHPCDGVCSANDSVDTCGNGCMPCPTVANGMATCNGIQCGLACDDGFSLNDDEDACVGCLSNAECTEVTASVCGATQICEACSDGGGCAHLPDTPICDNGTCVECSAADDSACGGNSCDPATGTCTQTPKESIGACEVCVADSECIADHDCVSMEFNGTARTDRYCLPMDVGGCDGLYGTAVNRTNAAGQAGDYCSIYEQIQTCEAIADYNTSCADASDCGADGLNDGLCEPIDFEFSRCTVPCLDFGQCPSSSLIGCATGGPNGEKWCGAY